MTTCCSFERKKENFNTENVYNWDKRETVKFYNESVCHRDKDKKTSHSRIMTILSSDGSNMSTKSLHEIEHRRCKGTLIKDVSNVLP